MTLFVATTSVDSARCCGGVDPPPVSGDSPPVASAAKVGLAAGDAKSIMRRTNVAPPYPHPIKRRDLATAPRTGPFLTAPPPGPARIRPRIISDSGFSRRLRETLVCSTKLNWNGLQRVVIRKHSLIGNKQRTPRRNKAVDMSSGGSRLSPTDRTPCQLRPPRRNHPLALFIFRPRDEYRDAADRTRQPEPKCVDGLLRSCSSSLSVLAAAADAVSSVLRVASAGPPDRERENVHAVPCSRRPSPQRPRRAHRCSPWPSPLPVTRRGSSDSPSTFPYSLVLGRVVRIRATSI